MAVVVAVDLFSKLLNPFVINPDYILEYLSGYTSFLLDGLGGAGVPIPPSEGAPNRGGVRVCEFAHIGRHCWCVI